ncbi:MAG: FGGY-family carbohydrate kinase [Streptosporangiales bacterium]
MATDLYAGIDVGTQSVRALVVDADGEVHGAGSAPLTSRRDGPRHEQDPGQWGDAVTTACTKALAGVPADAVRAVAVDATSGTVLLTDANGDAVTPGLMYDDIRAVDEAAEISEAGRELWTALGYGRMQPAWALPKLAWLLRHQPPPDAARVAHQGDYITGLLAGRVVPVDTSTALKTGCDARDLTWPGDLLDQLAVPTRMLPGLVLPGTPVGRVSPAASDATGLPQQALIVAGMTDGCAAQLGSGALEPGSWNSVLGTTLVLKGVVPELVRDPYGAVYSHRSPDGAWLPGGASSSGAGAITAQLPGRDLDALAQAAPEYEPSSALAYPLASARGERFPFVAPDATGFVLGRPESDAELYAALVQGIAYVERLCFDYLDLLGAPTGGRVVLTGGSTRSPYVRQVRADVLERPLTLVENAEPALGMAVLAAYGAGADAGNQSPLATYAAGMVRPAGTVEPRTGKAAAFHGPYLRLVDELAARGWLAEHVAAHARGRMGHT